MIQRVLILIPVILLAGCASQTVPLKKTSVTLVIRQSQSQSEVVLPPLITRVPQEVRLAWNPSSDSDVTNYSICYGTESHCYTHVIYAGLETNCIAINLVGGLAYYFAAMAEDAQGFGSDFSPELVYVPKTVMDLLFAFDQPVANVTLQTSSDFVRWQDLGTTPTNGTWRVTPDPSIPATFYRGKATTR